MSGKGKQRARSSDAEEDEDVDMLESSQANGNQHQNEDEEMEDGDDHGPDDEVTKKRKVRKDYRNLLSATQEHKSNLFSISVKDLTKSIVDADNMFKNVTAPAEAVIDSQVLMAASDAGALKARQLKLDKSAFDTEEFLTKLNQFMGGSSAQGARGRHDEEEEEEDEPVVETFDKWIKVGRMLAMESRRVPVLDHMYGPLSIQVKVKKARQVRATQKIDERERVRGEALEADDVQKDNQETSKMVSDINKILMDVEPIPYLAFIMNPDSFAQTVENMFYFSFLIKEGRAEIKVDTDPSSRHYQDAVCRSYDIQQAPDNQADVGKKQLVFELTEELWKDSIKAYDITESVIPTREQQQHKAGSKWH
ncbi:hypothetical protein T439DRAFT_323341 [Meredithblackwellia eburnea MCA 4105]